MNKKNKLALKNGLLISSALLAAIQITGCECDYDTKDQAINAGEYMVSEASQAALDAEKTAAEAEEAVINKCMNSSPAGNGNSNTGILVGGTLAGVGAVVAVANSSSSGTSTQLPTKFVDKQYYLYHPVAPEAKAGDEEQNIVGLDNLSYLRDVLHASDNVEHMGEHTNEAHSLEERGHTFEQASIGNDTYNVVYLDAIGMNATTPQKTYLDSNVSVSALYLKNTSLQIKPSAILFTDVLRVENGILTTEGILRVGSFYLGDDAECKSGERLGFNTKSNSRLVKYITTQVPGRYPEMEYGKFDIRGKIDRLYVAPDMKVHLAPANNTTSQVTNQLTHSGGTIVISTSKPTKVKNYTVSTASTLTVNWDNENTLNSLDSAKEAAKKASEAAAAAVKTADAAVYAAVDVKTKAKAEADTKAKAEAEAKTAYDNNPSLVSDLYNTYLKAKGESEKAKKDFNDADASLTAAAANRKYASYAADAAAAFLNEANATGDVTAAWDAANKAQDKAAEAYQLAGDKDNEKKMIQQKMLKIVTAMTVTDTCSLGKDFLTLAINNLPNALLKKDAGFVILSAKTLSGSIRTQSQSLAGGTFEFKKDANTLTVTCTKATTSVAGATGLSASLSADILGKSDGDVKGRFAALEIPTAVAALDAAVSDHYLSDAPAPMSYFSIHQQAYTAGGWNNVDESSDATLTSMGINAGAAKLGISVSTPSVQTQSATPTVGAHLLSKDLFMDAFYTAGQNGVGSTLGWQHDGFHVGVSYMYDQRHGISETNPMGRIEATNVNQHRIVFNAGLNKRVETIDLSATLFAEALRAAHDYDVSINDERFHINGHSFDRHCGLQLQAKANLDTGYISGAFGLSGSTHAIEPTTSINFSLAY